MRTQHDSYNLHQVGYTIVKRLESRLEQEEQKAKIERETWEKLTLFGNKCYTIVPLFATFGTYVVIIFSYVYTCFINSLEFVFRIVCLVIVNYTSMNTFRRILVFDQSVLWFHNTTSVLHLIILRWWTFSKSCKDFFKSKATIIQDLQANYFLSILRFPDDHMKHLMYTTFIIILSRGVGTVLEVICTGNNDHRLNCKT